MFHPSAIIDPGAKIGNGTRIWHFSHLMGTCMVGDDCVIGQNVYIDANVHIGNRVKIQNNVSIYQGVTIEDDVFLGPSMVFTNVINPRSFIERKNEFQTTIVRKGASISANATILCGIEIGSFAFVGAGAVVTKPVPPHAVVTGNPAKQTGWISEAGIPLVFNKENSAICSYTGQVFQLTEKGVQKLG